MADLDLSKLKSNYQTVNKWTSSLPGTSYSYKEITRDPVSWNKVSYDPVSWNKVSYDPVKYNPVEYKGTEYKTQSAGALKQNLAKQMRPSYDLQKQMAQQNTKSQNTAADVDAASRGMGTSTWVSDMKNRNYNALNTNLAGIEADYASNLYSNLLNRLSEQEARKIQSDQFNASNLLNTNLSNAQGLYNAALNNSQGKYNAALSNSQGLYNAALNNSQGLYNAALANSQGKLSADQWNSESAYNAAMANYQNQLALQQADLARNLELAQAMGVTADVKGGGGGPKLTKYMDEQTGQWKYGYKAGDGSFVQESDPEVIKKSTGDMSIKDGRLVDYKGKNLFASDAEVLKALEGKTDPDSNRLRALLMNNN